MNGDVLRSTEVLDLVNRRITSGGDIATPRYSFHIATIVSGGEEKMFALAGMLGSIGYDSMSHNSVEEGVEAANNLVEKRSDFGSVTAPRHLVC